LEKKFEIFSWDFELIQLFQIEVQAKIGTQLTEVKESVTVRKEVDFLTVKRLDEEFSYLSVFH